MNRRVLMSGLLSGAAVAPLPAVARAAQRTYSYEGAEVVRLESPERPGTIIIDTSACALHYILCGGEAIRYGVAVGKQGFDWAGIAKIGRKVEWPKWTPPRDMIVRRPELAKYADGVPP